MLELDVNRWSQQQFGPCQLGDARRVKRAVKFAAQVAADPSGSTPEQTEKWADCKAAYRLLDNDGVTFEALAGPHWQLTRARFRGHVLLIDDTSDIGFGLDRQIAGMGMINSERHPGFLLHSALALDAATGEVLGLAGQTIRHRRRCAKHETSRDRLKRVDRESRLWTEVIEQVGPPSAEAQYTHVCDRGADNFEVFCQLLQEGCEWVIRAAQLDRLLGTPHAGRQRLDSYLASLPLAGTYTLEVRGTTKHPPRTAQIEVRFGSVVMPRPQDVSQRVKESGIREIPMQVVQVREVQAPVGVEPLTWVLYTSHPLHDFEQARQVIGMYEQRWIIEEYHKALKTGCRLEQRLYATAARLEAVTGILAVVAVRLLQLKTVARTTPDRPAAEIVPARWITMLTSVHRGPPRTITTVYEFYRALAKLGGFLGRKRDGEPGWMTLWRGFEKLHLLVRGAEAYVNKCG